MKSQSAVSSKMARTQCSRIFLSALLTEDSYGNMASFIWFQRDAV